MSEPIQINAHQTGNSVYLSFPKDKTLVEVMRSLPVKHYNWRTQRWDIPLKYAALAHELLTAAGADASGLASAIGIHAVREVDAAAIERYPGLFVHQREGVRFLAASRGAILADDMGLGKTRQAIIAAHERRPEGEILVVCPASLKLNWRREIGVVYPDAEVCILNGPDEVVPARWTIINYDLLSKKRSYLAKHRWTCIVLDEAHYIKNQGSARSKAALSLLNSTEDRYLLTGTPVMNRPIDLYNLLAAVEHPLAEDYVRFGQRYCNGVKGEYGWDFTGSSNLDELRALTEGTILRRRKEDVLDLPPKLRGVVPVAIDFKRYERLHEEMLTALELNVAKNGGRPNWNQMLPVFTKLRHEVAKQKLKNTIQIVEDCLENGEKVVIFTGFTAVVDGLAAHFGESAVSLQGETPSTKRQEVVDSFQNDPIVRVFIGNITAAGIGITLTAASQVVFNDLDWVPANHAQAEDRAYRIGQDKTVNVTYVTAPGTIDDVVWFVLERKLAVLAQLDYARDAEAGAVLTTAEEILAGVLRMTDSKEIANEADRWLKEGSR